MATFFEIEPIAGSRLIGQRRIWVLLAGLVVLLIAMFAFREFERPVMRQPSETITAHGLGQEQIDAMIARLAARLEKEPQDAKGWVMLARAQLVMGRFDRASAAYAKSTALLPNDAQLLADYADALAMAQGGRLFGKPEQLVARALRLDPNNAKALALAGTIAFGDKDYALAIRHWQRLRALLPAGSEFAKSILANIDQAEQLTDVSAAVHKPAEAIRVTPSEVRQ